MADDHHNYEQPSYPERDVVGVALRARILEAYPRWRELFDTCQEHELREYCRSELGLSKEELEEAVLMGFPEAVSFLIHLDDSSKSLETLAFELKNNPSAQEIFQKAWQLEIQTGIPGIERFIYESFLCNVDLVANGELASLVNSTTFPWGPDLLEGNAAVGFLRDLIRRGAERLEDDEKRGSSRAKLFRLIGELASLTQEVIELRGAKTCSDSRFIRVMHELEGLSDNGIELALLPQFLGHHVTGNWSDADAILPKIPTYESCQFKSSSLQRYIGIVKSQMAQRTFHEMQNAIELEKALLLFAEAANFESDFIQEHANLRLLVEGSGGYEAAYEYFSDFRDLFREGETLDIHSFSLASGKWVWSRTLAKFYSHWSMYNLVHECLEYDDLITEEFSRWFVSRLHKAHEEGDLDASAELIAFHIVRDYETKAYDLINELKLRNASGANSAVQDGVLIALGKWFLVFLPSESRITWGNNILKKKFERAKSRMLKRVYPSPNQEEIALFHDSSILERGTAGFAVTTRGFFSRDTFGKPCLTDLKELVGIELSPFLKTLKLPEFGDLASPELDNRENYQKILGFLRCVGHLYSD